MSSKPIIFALPFLILLSIATGKLISAEKQWSVWDFMLMLLTWGFDAAANWAADDVGGASQGFLPLGGTNYMFFEMP